MGKKLILNESNISKVLTRAKKLRSLDPLWEYDNLKDMVPKLKAHDLYVIISRAGIGDSLEFLSLTTPSQICSFMDFDCWNKDTIIFSKFLDWIEAISYLGFEKLGSVIDHSDPEITSLFLARSTYIFNLREGDPPDMGNIAYYVTPDTFFEIRPKENLTEDVWKSITRLIENLYRYDGNLARKLILDSMWDIPINLEERAYKFMRGRLLDEGFTDYLDSLSVYKWLDPGSISLDSKIKEIYSSSTTNAVLSIPDEFSQTNGPFSIGLHELDDKKQDEVHASIIALLNKMAAADRISSADVELLNETGKLAGSCLDLGVAFISKNNKDKYKTVLENIAVSRIFRVGYSLTLQLKGLALGLSRSGHISLSPRTHTLLEGPWLHFYTSLTLNHPKFSMSMFGRDETKYFENLEQISMAGYLIEDLSYMKKILFAILEISPKLLTDEGLKNCNKNKAGEVTFGDLFRTGFFNYLVNNTFKTEAISEELFNKALIKIKEFSSDKIFKIIYEGIKDEFKKKKIDLPKRMENMVKTHLNPLYSKLIVPRAIVIIKTK